jgi:hypothetical protein
MYDLDLLEQAMIKEAAAEELLQEAELLKIAAAERAQRVVLVPTPALIPPKRGAIFGGTIGALGGLGVGLTLPGRAKLWSIPLALGGGLFGAGLGAFGPMLSRWLYRVE